MNSAKMEVHEPLRLAKLETLKKEVVERCRKVEAENAELKRQLSELENFAMLLCDDVFSMMVEMDLIEVQNYSGVLDTVERGRDGDFNG